MRKHNTTIKCVGFVLKHQHSEANTFALKMGKLLIANGVEMVMAEESRQVAEDLGGTFRKKIRLVSKPELANIADLIVVLGGDGTFLSIARLMKHRSVPILGVNMGQLGFLTEIKKEEALKTLEELLHCNIKKPPLISKRTLLEVTLTRNNKIILKEPVVNDAVISKGAIARIINLGISVDGKWVHDVRADGIIVSTPTGSTAYSLAAGGPIIEPSLAALIMTPICPHSLTQRPLVISDNSKVEIRLKDLPGHVLLTLDGQDAVDMKKEDILTVCRYKKHSLMLISSAKRDYYSVLREKLNFGMRS